VFERLRNLLDAQAAVDLVRLAAVAGKPALPGAPRASQSGRGMEMPVSLFRRLCKIGLRKQVQQGRDGRCTWQW